MCPIVMFFFTNGNGKFVFISSVLFTEEGDENDTQRKKLKTDINERQVNYNSKMKGTRKRGPKFHVDEFVSIKIDPVDKISPLHPNVLIGKITEVENDYAKIVTKFLRLKTYISTNRLNKCTAKNIQLEFGTEITFSAACRKAAEQYVMTYNYYAKFTKK